MKSIAALRIMIRSIQRRVDAGENLEEILDSYTNLDEDDKAYIREHIIIS